jgi:hypothetical protein
MVEKMDKIVGKVCIFFIMCAASFVYAGVRMELRTDNNSNQVVVGQPFTVDVVIEDVYGSVQTPEIRGLEKFTVKRTGTHMTSINGKSTTRYSYHIRIDTLGSYILGPAIVRHQQQELISNQLQVIVARDLGIATQKNKNNTGTESKAFLRMMVDSETVVVGQKINCSLRFYYQDTSISLHNIGIPELPGFDIKDVSKLEAGVAEIDGSQYRYAQWRWSIYPTKPGDFIIPAYNADYDIPIKDNNHLLAGFFMLLNNRVDRKRVYSNAAAIKVLPLPYFDGQVHAVGSFERFSASIKPGIAKEGEGMVFTLEIEGNGNLHAVEIPKILIPDGLRYYESHSMIIAPECSDELPKKRFEFIVQGMKPGNYEISEQLFTYFDIERNTYTTLRTPILAVSIMPGTVSAKKDISSVNISGSSEQEGDDIVDTDIVGQWYPVEQQQPLQWWIFQVLFLLPCLYIGYPVICGKLIAITGSSARFARRRAFQQARKKVDHAMKFNDGSYLYAIFVELLQQLDRIPSQLHIEKWTDFFDRITHAAYAKSDENNTSELCRMAKQWLEHLEKTL